MLVFSGFARRDALRPAARVEDDVLLGVVGGAARCASRAVGRACRAAVGVVPPTPWSASAARAPRRRAARRGRRARPRTGRRRSRRRAPRSRPADRAWRPRRRSSRPRSVITGPPNLIAMVIAIDGPAGAGKSSVARAAAERLGFTYLDTGAMYRAVAFGRRGGGDAAEVARAARLELGERVTLDGEDVTERIREPWVSEAASRVSSDPAVREALVEQQRRILADGDWVAEGRDIGTVVAPDAEVKVFLTADPARARAPPRRRARHRRRRRAARAGACATSATAAARLAARARARRGAGRHHRPHPRRRSSSRSSRSRSRPRRSRREEDRRRRVSRTSASPRSSTASRSRARRSCTSGRGSRATARSSRPTGTAASFALIDTGGVDLEDTDPLAVSIQDQVREALSDADVALLVVDGTRGLPRRRRGGRRHAAQGRPAGRAGRQQDRLAARLRRSSTTSTASGSASRWRCRPRRGSAPATCSTASSSCCPRATSPTRTRTSSASR